MVRDNIDHGSVASGSRRVELSRSSTFVIGVELPKGEHQRSHRVRIYRIVKANPKIRLDTIQNWLGDPPGDLKPVIRRMIDEGMLIVNKGA